ncbi:RNA dependent RNA polymerase-domain-containing protein [Crassisporium funariophilum]|nr:RNA dependent RNA polymerase-domain-containing protein [Crassisporium funariophilum]
MDHDDPLLGSGRDAWDLISEPDSVLYEGDISAIICDYEEGPVESTQADSVVNSAAAQASFGFSVASRKRQASDSSNDSLDSHIPPKRQKLSVPFSTSSSTLEDPPYPGKPYLIAHCPEVELALEEKKICYGVRYELARLISAGLLQYSDITEEKLDALRGPTRDAAPKLATVFLGKSTLESGANDPIFAKEMAAKSPWEELDLEEVALSRGPFEGLGNNADNPGWYGGKVEFRGKLQQIDGNSKSYKLQLDSCTLGPSSRNTRRFGSWSFLRVKIPLPIFHQENNNLESFFKQTFVIWGEVFRACYAKERNVFFFRTNEIFPMTGPLIPGRLSLEEFIMWHNPLEHNRYQLMTKWAARSTLGFSNSVPGPRILQEFIGSEEDIVSEQGSDMTDGCGLSSKGIHNFVLHKRNLPSLPTAFQFRFEGCKGMSLLRDDGNFEDGEMRVWFRPSQRKIKYPPGQPLDPAMLTFDILRTARMTTPVRISAEIIINLAENGVPHHVFTDLFKTSIRQMVAGFTTWDGPDAMYNLWINVERAEGVLSARRAREAVGEARFRGYSNFSPEDLDPEDEEADEDGLNYFDSAAAQRSTAWWPDQISGCPSSIAETCMTLIDSGFQPQDTPVLREKLKLVVNKKIENWTRKLRLTVEQSLNAFVVPDPFGVLGENEIQVKSSKRNLKTEDGLLTDILLGDVLLTRNPCKVPTDVRKVKAVDHPYLRNYVDVIVCSVQGFRRLLDWLAGGDYDGDIAVVLWFRGLVENFQNADEKYAVEPIGLDMGFVRDEETGAAFLQRLEGLQTSERLQAMQAYLLGGLRDTSLVGKYSAMHDNAMYELGYGHPRTVKLAAKFCKVMDGTKTGWRVKRETFTEDYKRYHHQLGPRWKASSKEKRSVGSPRIETSNIPHLRRDKSSAFVKGRFIMDVLHDAATKEKDLLLAKTEEVFTKLDAKPDEHLTEPWDIAQARVEKAAPEIRKMMTKDLDIIAAHVHTMYARDKQNFRKGRAPGSSTVAFTGLPIEVRQDTLRSTSKAFASFPQLDDLSVILDQASVARLRASYAFKYDAQQNSKYGTQGWSRFPWNNALRDLCSIKAAALGPHKSVTSDFYERFKLTERR